jgi:hypothetical protein
LVLIVRSFKQKVLTYKINLLSNSKFKSSNPAAYMEFSLFLVLFLLSIDLCDVTINGPEEPSLVRVGARACFCVRKKNFKVNKNFMKQYPYILKYRRSSSKDSEVTYVCP